MVRLHSKRNCPVRQFDLFWKNQKKRDVGGYGSVRAVSDYEANDMIALGERIR